MERPPAGAPLQRSEREHRVLGPEHPIAERRLEEIDVRGQDSVGERGEAGTVHGSVAVDEQVEVDDPLAVVAPAIARAIQEDRLHRVAVARQERLRQGLGSGRHREDAGIHGPHGISSVQR